jgi:hypothetical protein
LPIKKFKIIKNNLPTINTFLDLSTDQKYLLEIVQAVSLDEIDVSLSFRNPGKLSHARWLTMANRILRLYVGTENPSKNLQLLAEYIIKVYAPIWFHIKLNPLYIDGPRHIFKIIELSRCFPKNIINIIDTVIQ